MPNYKRYPKHTTVGDVLKDGRVVITNNSYIWPASTNTFQPLFDVCRTVAGGPVKVRKGSVVKYLIISADLASLIELYNESTTHYAGLSLQEFLVKTWKTQ